MRTITIKPSGLSFTESYRLEVYNYNTPSTLVFSKDNILNGMTITFPVMNPGTYIVKIFNMKDVSNICVPTQFSEQLVNAYFPIVSYVVSETDCSNETYTVTLTIDNPETSGDVQFGWANTSSCTNINLVEGNTIIFPSDGNNKYIFARYEDCCDLVLTVNKPPCINCNIAIESIITSCDNSAPIPTPTESCNSYRLINGIPSSIVFYVDCTTSELKFMSLLSEETQIICSNGVPTTSYDVTIELLGNCPENNTE